MLRSFSQTARTGRRTAEADTARAEGFQLVRRATRLDDVPLVEQHLPEILGRALARSWIDLDFSDKFLSDPKGLLASYQVFLPATVTLEVEASGTDRPRVVVFEGPPGRGRRRLMYLQLVMLAGR